MSALKPTPSVLGPNESIIHQQQTLPSEESKASQVANVVLSGVSASSEVSHASVKAPSREKLFSYTIDQCGLFEFSLTQDKIKGQLTGQWNYKVPLGEDLKTLRETFENKMTVFVDNNKLEKGSRIPSYPYKIEIFLGPVKLHSRECDPRGSISRVLESKLLLSYDLRMINQRGKPYLEQLAKASRNLVPGRLLADLHTHYGGAMSVETIVKAICSSKEPILYPTRLLKDMGVKYFCQHTDKDGNIDLASKETTLFWNKFARALKMNSLRVETFSGMEKVYIFRGPIVKNLSLFPIFLERLAKYYKEMGVQYAELSVSDIVKPEWLEKAHEILPQLEKQYGVKLRFLVGLWRHSPLQYNLDIVEKIKTLRDNPYIVGIDIMGHETNSTRDIIPLLDECANFKKDYRPDFVIRVHSGESSRHPENVPLAIEHGATRIGHGLYYSCSPEVIELAKKNNVIFEINISSNQALHSVVLPKDQIPVEYFLDNEVRVTVGSDGHGMYGTNHLIEAALIEQFGLNSEHFKKIAESDKEYIEMMNGYFEKRMLDPQKALRIPPPPTPLFSSDEWKRLGQELENKKLNIEKHVSGLISSTTGDPIEFIKADQLDSRFDGKTPIIVAGASTKSWDDPVPEDDKILVKQKLREFFHNLDNTKVVIITGGTEFGLERQVHEVIEEYAKKGKKFQLLGALAPELEADINTISKRLSHATIMGESWYDTGPIILSWVSRMKGIAYFIGGGEVIKAQIQISKNTGNIEYFLMKGIHGSSDTEAKLCPHRGFSKNDGLCQILLDSSKGNLLKSMVMTPQQAATYFQNTNKRILTFMGYSSPYKDIIRLEATVRDVLSQYNRDETIINAGATEEGIGMVYKIAKELGFQTTGIVTTLAKDNPNIPLSSDVDFTIFIEDEKWGGIDSDTGQLSPVSEAIVLSTHEAVALGGGIVSEVECNALEEAEKDVVTFPFQRAGVA